MPHPAFRIRLAGGVVALVLIVGTAHATGIGLSAGSAAVTGLRDCGPGIPLVKCNESLYKAPPRSSSQPSPGIVPQDVPTMVRCGATFFDSETQGKLAVQFGGIECFGLVGGTRWIVFGDGMSSSSADFEASRGGSVLAVEQCATADSACLDPSALHSFGDFVVSYPPKPMSGRSSLQGTDGDHLVQVVNGFCGLFVFDVRTLHWYDATSQTIAGLEAGTSVVPAVPRRPTVPGFAALTQAAPPYVGGCAS